MKTCPKCNMSGIPDDATFCPKCGAKIVRRKKDSQQLLNEAVAAWEIYPHKTKNDFRTIGEAVGYAFIGNIFIGGVFCAGGLIKGEDFNDALSFGLNISLIFMGVLAVPFLIAALIMYIQDIWKLKKAKNAFVEKYIQANEYE